MRMSICALIVRAIVLCVVITGCSARRSYQAAPEHSITKASESSKHVSWWSETFDELRPDLWREVDVSGDTDYEIVTLDGVSCLKAESRGGASIMLSPVTYDPDKYKWLSWTWRVDSLVENEDLRTKQGSDAAARVYVYFETWGLPWQKRSIDYVWSANLPVGTVLDSAFSSSSKIIVVESGAEHLGQWRHVERNIEDDFKLCFGKSVPDVIGIGVMNDADNTNQYALAYFDELSVHEKAFGVVNQP